GDVAQAERVDGEAQAELRIERRLLQRVGHEEDHAVLRRPRHLEAVEGKGLLVSVNLPSKAQGAEPASHRENERKRALTNCRALVRGGHSTSLRRGLNSS